MKKTYTCNRFKQLQIGSSIRFADAVFTTEDETLQAQVESNEWYGIFIHPQEHYPAAEKRSHHKAPPVEAESSVGVSSGLSGTKKMRF